MSGLAFSTNAFKRHTLEEAIDAIADAGYRGVELMADRPHLYPRDYDAPRRRQLLGQLARRELLVSNINAFTLFASGDTYHPTWIEDDAEQRNLRIKHTIDCIDLAVTFSSKTISIQPGGPLIGTTLSRHAAGERFASALQEVLTIARQHNIIVAIEPEPGLFIESSVEYLDFKRTFFDDEPRIRMNCDIGHLFCVGEDPATVIRSIPQEIAHVHFEDIGKNRVHQHLAPGKGAIDFRSIFDALDAISYDGWVTVELYPYETTAADVAKAAWKYLQPMISE